MFVQDSIHPYLPTYLVIFVDIDVNEIARFKQVFWQKAPNCP